MSRLSITLLTLAACSAPASQSSSTSQPTSTQTVIGSETQPTTGSQPSPAGSGCPNIQIKAPDSVSAGQQARITTITADGSAGSFNWTVSGGTIVGGQGTSVITIDTTGLGGSSITATVELGGLAAECETRSASTTVLVGR